MNRATIRRYTVSEYRWVVQCPCGEKVGTATCKSEAEADQLLEHHSRQVRHREWMREQVREES